MSKTPFIDGDAPRPGGKESEAAKQEWEQTEKPKKLIGMVLLAVLIVGGGIGMAFLMKATAPDAPGEEEEVADKSQWLTLTNNTDAMAWVDCIIGDPEDGGMEYSKKLSSKEKTLVELTSLPVECKAKDADGTEYWSWRGMKYGSPEEGIVLSVKRDGPPPEKKPEAPAEEPDEGAEKPPE